MINNILFIALVVLGVTEIFFAVAFIMLINKLSQLKFDYEFMREVLKINNNTTEKLCDSIDKENEIYHNMLLLVEGYGQQYDEIYDAYLNMDKTYRAIVDHIKKVIKTWEGISEDYQNSFEQFKRCSDEIKILNTRFENFINDNLPSLENNKFDADYLGAEYVNAFYHVEEDDDENPFVEKKAKTSSPCADCIHSIYNEELKIHLCSCGEVCLGYDRYEPSNNPKRGKEGS